MFVFHETACRQGVGFAVRRESIGRLDKRLRRSLRKINLLGSAYGIFFLPCITSLMSYFAGVFAYVCVSTRLAHKAHSVLRSSFCTIDFVLCLCSLSSNIFV